MLARANSVELLRVVRVQWDFEWFGSARPLLAISFLHVCQAVLGNE